MTQSALAPSRQGSAHEALLHERVGSSGLFDVSVAVSSHGAADVKLQIGTVVRRARTRGPGHHATVHVRMPISGRMLTVRASANFAAPEITVSMHRVGGMPWQTQWYGSHGKPAGSGSTKAGGGSTGLSEPTVPTAVLTPVGSTGSGSTGPTGAAGSSGAQGSTGSTGSTGTGSTGTGSGSTGSTGSGGSTGSSGSTGSGGSTGSSGSGGSTGSSGSGGSTGSSGSTGSGSLGPQPLGVPGSWHSIFDDEFTGSALSTRNWSTGWGGAGLTGPINTEEMQCYTPAQVVQGGGELDLNLIHQAQSNCPLDGGGSVNEGYTSGMIQTQGKFSFTYGYFETRVWLPGGSSGVDWPGVWAVGANWPAGGELDLVEGLAGQACWHFHDPQGGPGGCAGVYTGGWHTFGADWEPGSVTWYYDGSQVGTVTQNVTTSPMFLLATMALDNTYGGAIQAPATMRIDYVRVWQH